MDNTLINEKSKTTWVRAQSILENWQINLASFELSHRAILKSLLSSFSSFFNCPCPKEINIDLHYHPGLDQQKGEPADGLTSTGRLPKNDANIIYWLGQISDRLDNQELGTTSKIIHEEIHQDLQKRLFKDILVEANKSEVVRKLRTELMIGQVSYLEPEAELTAIYLEHYARRELSQTQNHKITPPLVSVFNYRLDENRFHQIFKAVVEEDNAWKQDGPYTALRRGWGLPDFLRESSELSHDIATGPNLYQLGDKITNFSLFESYHSKSRSLGLEFIERLYSLFLELKRKI